MQKYGDIYEKNNGEYILNKELMNEIENITLDEKFNKEK